MLGNAVVIGSAIRIKGEVVGEEDLIIEGKVEGTIALKNNHLTVEKTATMTGDVDVQNITVKGELHGNTTASDRVEVTSTAKVQGDIKTPRLVMADGAKFKGAVEMDVPLPADLNVKVA